MAISELIKIICRLNIDTLDAELIIADQIKKPREFVVAHPEFYLQKRQIAAIKRTAKKRGRGLPLAYLIGSKQFYGLDFAVNKNVLVPRPETEIIIDHILGTIEKEGNKNNHLFYDIGTGSGCIIISLAFLLGKKNIYLASDISSGAVKTAKINAVKNKVNRIVDFKKGHLAMPFIKRIFNSKNKKFIIANLPYLTKKQYNSSPSIRHEPLSSLVSRDKGMSHYHALLKQLSMFNDQEFSLFCEISPGQYDSIKKIGSKYLPDAKINCLADLCGKKRFAVILNKVRLRI